MIAKQSAYPGNTLGEYSLMIGLVAVLGLAAVTTLGDGISGLFGKPSQGQHQSNMKSLVSLNFGGGGGGNGSGSAGSSSGIGAQMKGAANNGTLMPDGTLNNEAYASPAGVNVTSVEGGSQVQAVQHTVSEAKAMLSKADSLPEGALKEWYKAAAQETFLLAGNEATLSYKKDNVTQLQSLVGENMTQGDAIYEISNHYSKLGMFINALPPNITAAEKSAALASVGVVMDTLKSTYASDLSKYTVMTNHNGQPSMTLNVNQLTAENMTFGQANYTKSATDIAQVAGGIVASGSADNTPAVKTSLQTGIGMTNP